MKRIVIVLLVAAALACAAPIVLAGSFDGTPGASVFTPRVPVSGLARPMQWFDASRLRVSTTVSVGTGFGGTTDALQVTRLSYQFGTPLWMSVSVGNAFGPASRGTNPMFLEGLDLVFRPSASMVFQVRYQDLRSPLQYGSSGFGYWADPYRVR